MNGFSSAILTLLLGWLRALFNSLWRVLSSESGSSFLSFLRLHWKTVFIILCVGGFVLDRIIYFFRWRPDYVWSSRWGRLKRSLSQRKPYSREAAPQQRRQATQVEEVRDDWMYDPLPASTRDFAPLATEDPEVAYGAPPLADIQPVFDDPTEVWTPVAAHGLSMESYQQPYENPAEHLIPGFGLSTSEPSAYLRENQEGYAMAPTSEIPYPSREILPQSEPIHPGLDLETFQQNIGLNEPQEPASREKPLLRPVVAFPNPSYVSFYREADKPETPVRSKGSLSSLAKKARELVRVSDEDNPPSIRDLQPTADFKTAFHAPVLPKKPGEADEE